MRKIKERRREREGVCVCVIHWYTNGMDMVLNKQINENDETCTHTHTLFRSLFPSSFQSVPAGMLLITNV